MAGITSFGRCCGCGLVFAWVMGRAAAAGGGQVRRVLVVESEESFSDAPSYLLRREGFEVAVCPTGPDALAALDRAGADLVLLDLMLRRPPGAEVLTDSEVNTAAGLGVAPTAICENWVWVTLDPMPVGCAGSRGYRNGARNLEALRWPVLKRTHPIFVRASPVGGSDGGSSRYRSWYHQFGDRGDGGGKAGGDPQR